ncbi:hypothetical protein [uncultured Mobiluncus sp.]|uniref:hypothetical protein n=1 Tax=uncultured Mobiluncus sp. TaxID=293425 RepID=UPI00261CD263|nr:hypothetical protein [uncultured Mobiluncus sp.]
MSSADEPKYAMQAAGKTLRSAPGDSRAAVFIDSLSQGSTFLAAVGRSGLSVEHRQLLLEHLHRAGMLANRNNSVNTSCAHGACVPGEVTAMSDQQRLHCVGCPLSQL